MDVDFIGEVSSHMLDGNAIAGLLYELFNAEMTLAPVECATCGHTGVLGSLWAFVENPGYVIRCPACQNIILRLAITPHDIYLDARGASYVRIPHREQS
jgi:hypothetical protein